MTLADILSHGERVIILSDHTGNLIYTWNQSLTIQLWAFVGKLGRYPGAWEEIDITTLSEQPKTLAEAQAKIRSIYM